MATAVKGQRAGISYAGTDNRLIERLPPGLKSDQRVTPSFEYEANPERREDVRANQKTESQRRGEQDPGSTMVKLHKPIPEPKPNNHLSVLRQHFNQRWADEMHRANQERSHGKSQTSNDNPTPVMKGPQL